MTEDTSSHDAALADAAARVSPERISTYAKLWQFETWLRTMVYVELRACFGNDWQPHLKVSSQNPRKQDKRLTHMPTRETLPTSYMQLGDLLDTIEGEWVLFENYFPPKDIWQGKLDEMIQIRHRVTHFRIGHKHDASRLHQLLCDVDQGFWQFCTSYNADAPVLPASRDPVTNRFLPLDALPWRETKPGRWARIGTVDRTVPVSVTIVAPHRPWLKPATTGQIAGEAGYFYDVTLLASRNRAFEYSKFLDRTKYLHRHVCHICLDSHASTLRVTIPAVLGVKRVTEVLESLVDFAHYSLRPVDPPPEMKDILSSVGVRREWADTVAEQYPEYVLGPSNPLTFLCPEMPCSFFNVE